MKALSFLPLLLALGCASPFCSAQDYGLYWKYKDYDGNIALTVPALAIDIGSWFLDDKSERVLLRRINKVRVMAFEGSSPVSDRDLKRFDRKAKRRHLDDLVLVKKGKMQVRIMAKERRNTLRKVVVLVQSPEGFALVSVKGRLRIDDINRVIEKYGKEAKKKGKTILPPEIKVPVSRV